MSYTYHGTTDLIALPNRTVQTYPSGLVRVERSFVCRKDRVARFRNTIKVNEPMPLDDGAPAVDGLYIFPEPQEIVRDDGFVEFRVTAYGRTGVEAPLEISTVRGTLSVDYGGTGADRVIVPVAAVFENYVVRKVFPANQSIESLLQPPNIIPKAYIGGRAITSGPYYVNSFTTINYFIQIFLQECSSTNFGIWSEYVVAYQSTGSGALVISLAIN